ncbi:MAG: C10 family peptidase [Bacteroidales bacterium]|jgi:hypothetical protein|nr:C10 family peptidase [Bacteroidales bacterium]
MKKIILITLVSILIVGSLFSQKVTKEDALRVGLNFYQHNAKELSLTKSNYNVENYSTLKASTNPEAIHIFDFEEGGFVIVSGDMSFTPILGYSYEGNFMNGETNPAVESWLNDYLMQMESAYEQKISPSPEILDVWADYASNNFSQTKARGDGVMPMIKTKWNQGKYYNYYCPTHPQAKPEYDGKVVTGCVATAMAQVMNYYKYPSRGKGQGQYFWGETITINYENEYYNWDKELPEKLNESVVSQDSSLMYSVAKLMFHTGVSVYMNYGPFESGSSLEYAVISMRNNFRYRSGIELKYQSEVPNDEEWRFLLRNELDLRRPVLYRGNSSTGGHAFICDGYQGSYFFHFNWGWGGSEDGFYYVGNLNPNNNMLYASNQGIMLNVAPEGEAGTHYKYCTGELIIPFPEGSFGDGSGYNNYFPNTDCQWLLTVENADTAILNNYDSLRIFFNTFDVKAGDVLTIYDGNSTEAPILFKYDGINETIGIPEGQSIKNSTLNTTGKNLYFSFVTTDSRNTANGWEITYAVVVKGNAPTGVDDNTLSHLTIYPNPATNNLTINGLEGKATAQVYDIYGKLLMNINNLQDGSVDVSSLASGIYFVKVENKNNTRTMRFIKQ